MLFAALLAAEGAGAAPQGYVMGVFPFLSSSRLEQNFAPLAARLASELGRPVSYRSAADFDRFERAIQEARFDFAFIQPFDYVRFAAPAGYRPLARVLERAAGVRTVFYVQRQSAVSALSDLRGRTLSTPPSHSATARLADCALRAEGLVPGRDVTIHEASGHAACLEEVTVGNVAACASGAAALNWLGHAASLRAIGASAEIGAPTLVAHPRVPAALRARLTEALLRWSADSDAPGNEHPLLLTAARPEDASTTRRIAAGGCPDEAAPAAAAGN